VRKLKKIKRKAKAQIYDKGNLLLYAFRKKNEDQKEPDSPFINKKELRILGLQRSGNHAIINWIFTQCKELKCYLNFVKPHCNPFLSFERRGTVKEFQKDFFEKFNISKEKLGIFSAKDTLIYSYEDELPEDVFFSETFSKNRVRWVGHSKEKYNILILRDPFNLFASRLKREENQIPNQHMLKVEAEKKKLIKLWKSHAELFINAGGLSTDEEIITINYNSWFTDKNYREQLAKTLNIEFNDSTINEVLPIGGGSSFDSLNKNNSAEEMEVLERWKHYKDNEFFSEIFKDKELIELSEQIFGKLEGTECFLS
jgi:hypothetical protein